MRNPLALTPYGRPGRVAPSAGPPAVAAAAAFGREEDGSRSGTYRYFLRGRRHAAQPGDMVARASRAPKLSGFDQALKRFRYHEALDAALQDGSPDVRHASPSRLPSLARRQLSPLLCVSSLATCPSAQMVVSVMEELVLRHGLRIALQGRDQQTLQPLVAFLARQIVSPPVRASAVRTAAALPQTSMRSEARCGVSNWRHVLSYPGSTRAVDSSRPR